MLRLFSSSLLALLALAAAAWLSPADALGCSGGNGTCFVLAAGGNSNSTATFSQTSGGASCVCVPATTDTVILDSASGQLTVSAAFSIGSLLADGTGQGASGSYTGVLTQSGGIGITINGASNGNGKFSLVSGMTYSPAASTSIVTFVNTGVVTLTSGGKNFAGVTINSGVGTVLQGDDLNVTAAQNATFTLTGGIYSSGSFGLTTGIFSSSNSNNRTLTLGTFLKVGGNVATAQTLLSLTTTNGLIFNKNNAFVEVAVPTTAIAGADIRVGGLAFNALILDANSSFNSGLGIVSSGSWTTWTIGSGWTLIYSAGISNTLSGAAVFNGTPSRPIVTVLSAGTATPGTLSASSCTATWASFFGLTVPTGCTAGNGFNLGGDVGITFTQPRFGGVIGG